MRNFESARSLLAGLFKHGLLPAVIAVGCMAGCAAKEASPERDTGATMQDEPSSDAFGGMADTSSRNAAAPAPAAKAVASSELEMKKEALEEAPADSKADKDGAGVAKLALCAPRLSRNRATGAGGARQSCSQYLLAGWALVTESLLLIGSHRTPRTGRAGGLSYLIGELSLETRVAISAQCV